MDKAGSKTRGMGVQRIFPRFWKVQFKVLKVRGGTLEAGWKGSAAASCASAALLCLTFDLQGQTCSGKHKKGER